MGTPKKNRADVTNAAALLGSKGGRVKSKAKAAAARENGKKGGRPRKRVNTRKAGRSVE